MTHFGITTSPTPKNGILESEENINSFHVKDLPLPHQYSHFLAMENIYSA